MRNQISSTRMEYEGSSHILRNDELTIRQLGYFGIYSIQLDACVGDHRMGYRQLQAYVFCKSFYDVCLWIYIEITKFVDINSKTVL